MLKLTSWWSWKVFCVSCDTDAGRRHLRLHSLKYCTNFAKEAKGWHVTAEMTAAMQQKNFWTCGATSRSFGGIEQTATEAAQAMQGNGGHEVPAAAADLHGFAGQEARPTGSETHTAEFDTDAHQLPELVLDGKVRVDGSLEMRHGGVPATLIVACEARKCAKIDEVVGSFNVILKEEARRGSSRMRGCAR